MYRVAKSGGAPQTIATTVAEPLSIALDGDSIYWIAAPATAAAHLMVAPKSGGSSSEIVVDAPLNAGPSTLAVDASGIYWIDEAANLRATPRGGGPSTILSDEYGALNMVADDTSIYYQAPSGADLRVVSKSGGPITVLSAGARAFYIALLGDNVYWADPFSSQIWRVAKTGGSASFVVMGSAGGMGGLSVDDDCVYWVDYPKNPANDPTRLMKADNGL
jgi:hypothetical protein